MDERDLVLEKLMLIKLIKYIINGTNGQEGKVL